jgi:ribonuclease BN (tRNA processing enzyme)
MKITVLGCGGGISATAHTTSLLVGDQVLIDAGTGVNGLSLEAMRRIDHVFLTHSHLDHLAALPLLLDSVSSWRQHPVTVYAQEVTLQALRDHVFNNIIWPDFSRIPTAQQPFMRYQTLPAGGAVTLGALRVQSIPVNHVVPGVGYLVGAGQGSLAFSGDTTETDEFWRVLNACRDLRHVIVETSFLDKDERICRLAHHYTPRMLANELRKLKPGPSVHVTHLMPGMEDAIMAEIAAHHSPHAPRRLREGETFEV